jgi:hypothetical protein
MKYRKNDRRNGKYCARCKAVLPREAFGINNNNSDGLAGYCREHSKEASKLSYMLHAEERRARRMEYYNEQKRQAFARILNATGD